MDVQILGLAPTYVPFSDALDVQKRIHDERVNDEVPDTLLLLEHEPVYTAGAQTRPAELPPASYPVERVDRGGRITWHGPGQLVGYPIIKLREPLDVVAHVRFIESALRDVLASIGVDSYLVPGRSGVWVRDRTGAEAKIAAIGVRVARGVTRHGFALNCNNDLAPFSKIIPCGISDASVTTISEVLGTAVRPTDLIDIVSAMMSQSLRLEATA